MKDELCLPAEAFLKYRSFSAGISEGWNEEQNTAAAVDFSPLLKKKAKKKHE